MLKLSVSPNVLHRMCMWLERSCTAWWVHKVGTLLVGVLLLRRRWRRKWKMAKNKQKNPKQFKYNIGMQGVQQIPTYVQVELVQLENNVESLMLVLKFKWSIYHKALVLNSKGVFHVCTVIIVLIGEFKSLCYTPPLGQCHCPEERSEFLQNKH